MTNTDIPECSTVELLHDFDEGNLVFHKGDQATVLLNDHINNGILVEIKVEAENVLNAEEDDSDGWLLLAGEDGKYFRLIYACN